jgi:hypothetical protein
MNTLPDSQPQNNSQKVSPVGSGWSPAASGNQFSPSAGTIPETPGPVPYGLGKEPQPIPYSNAPSWSVRSCLTTLRILMASGLGLLSAFLTLKTIHPILTTLFHTGYYTSYSRGVEKIVFVSSGINIETFTEVFFIGVAFIGITILLGGNWIWALRVGGTPVLGITLFYLLVELLFNGRRAFVQYPDKAIPLLLTGFFALVGFTAIWLLPARPLFRGARSYSKRGTYWGEVRGLRERAETERNLNPFNPNGQNKQLIVWTFRLERYENGQRLPPIPVEMRGESFSGFINEGDRVTLSDTWQDGTIVKPRTVYNQTSGSEVRVINRTSIMSKLATCIGVLSLLFVLGVILVIASQIFR